MALPKREFTGSEFAFLALSACSSPTSKPGKALACCAKRAGGGQAVILRIPPPLSNITWAQSIADSAHRRKTNAKGFVPHCFACYRRRVRTLGIVLFRRVLGVFGPAERQGFKTRTDRNAPPLPKHTVPFEAGSVLLRRPNPSHEALVRAVGETRRSTWQ